MSPNQIIYLPNFVTRSKKKQRRKKT